VTPTTTTTYTVTETNSNGCSHSDSVTVTVNPLPTPLISGADTVCTTQKYIYSTPSVSGISYSWTPSNGTITSGAGTNSVDVVWGSPSSGSISVTETNSTTGCQKTITYNVLINPKPTTTSIFH
jgi:hypothetical protein